MDIVIPYQHSINKDAELRYALRSACAFIQHDNVHIFGDEPAWPHKNLHVHQMENAYRDSRYRDFNIYKKILRACFTDTVSNDFIILHDDNFLLKPFNPATYWHQGNRWRLEGMYGNVERNTLDQFGALINNYDVHAPHAVNSNKFINTLGKLNWNKPYGYCIKTAYAVMNNIPGVQVTDLKINAFHDEEHIVKQITGRAFFSIGDTAWKPAMLRVMQALYPKASQYEK